MSGMGGKRTLADVLGSELPLHSQVRPTRAVPDSGSPRRGLNGCYQALALPELTLDADVHPVCGVDSLFVAAGVDPFSRPNLAYAIKAIEPII
jgi:hypothetical protein